MNPNEKICNCQLKNVAVDQAVINLVSLAKFFDKHESKIIELVKKAWKIECSHDEND